jgi:hypothetical protein
MRFSLSTWQKRGLMALAWLALTVYFYVPVANVMDVTLDSSNYASYSYFTAHHFQYGPQVVPMAGPYGFVLYGFVYSPDLFWVRTFCELAMTGTFALLVLRFLTEYRGSRWRWAWLGALLVFSSVLEDFPPEWMMLLGGLLLFRLRDGPGARGWTAGIGVMLAFLSLLKGTHFVLAGATLAVILAQSALRRDFRGAATLAMSFAGGFLLFWVLAGQNPFNIPSFINGIHQLTNGYNGAMSLQEEFNVTARGLIVLAALAGAFGWAAWNRRRDLGALAGVALLSGFAFVKWKHGFVRADGHVYIFFHYAVVAALTIYLHSFSGVTVAISRRARMIGMTFVLLAIAGGFYGAGERNLPRIRWLIQQVPVQARQRFAQVFSLGATKTRFDREMAEQRATFAMPLTKQAVGNGRVDLLGVKHGIIPLNGLNFSPRPMGGGSFNAYNRFLTETNRDFIRDPVRRPEYYMVKLDTIDNRFISEDDPLSLIAVLQHYTPVLLEQGYLLLRATPVDKVDEPRLLKRQRLHFGETIEVPAPPPGTMVLARFQIPLSMLGLLRSAAYKPPLVFMSVIGQGIEFPHSRRVVPSMVESPFVLSPVIEDAGDILNLYTPRPGKRMDSLGLFTDHPDYFAADDLAIEFFTLPRPRVPDDFDVEELMTAAHFPISNIPPEAVHPADAPSQNLRGLPVLKLEPPGEIVWKLNGNEREILFDYGIDPYAYENGKGNGVVFIVELQSTDERRTELYRSHLDPFKRLEDRGNHSARVILPVVKPGMRLILKTDPGEYGDSAWDWSYFTRVQIKRGEFSLKQFPGFNVAPVAADADHSSVINDGKTSVLVLHAPGMLAFQLHGREHRVQFDYGFMPGAYTAGGNTDGAAFVVELARPNQPKEVLFRRDLRPVQQEGDRGRLHADVAIPVLGPADRLIVRTEIGPNGDASWDWTYLSNFILE